MRGFAGAPPRNGYHVTAVRYSEQHEVESPPSTSFSFFIVTKPKQKSSWVVRSSVIHGRGTFATDLIRKGTRIIEYRGARSTMEVACQRPATDPNNPYHTFIFEISDGTVIDASIAGNAARWINHSCEPNCEAIEDDDRVFIHATRTIYPGEELAYDYRLSVDGRITPRVRKAFFCACGADFCRGTMLLLEAPPATA